MEKRKKLIELSYGCGDLIESQLFWVPEETTWLGIQRIYNKALKKYRKWKGKQRKKGIEIYNSVHMKDFMEKTLSEFGWIPFRIKLEVMGSIDNPYYCSRSINDQNQNIIVSNRSFALEWKGDR